MNLITWHERLKFLREQNGWTMNEIAEKVGAASPQTYSGWEYGRREPDFETIVKLARTYNVSIDWIIKGNDPMLSDSVFKNTLISNGKMIDIKESEARFLEGVLGLKRSELS